jgi:aminoglycoside 6'-N-acetyltransferase
MSPPFRLETTRLILRPFEERDLPTFVEYRSDPDVARYQSWQTPYTMEQARTFLRAKVELNPSAPDGWQQIAIELKSTAVMIGDCAYCILADAPEKAEIGFTLSQQHQRQGFAFEAVSRLIEYLFDNLCIERVVANIDIENARSSHLLERLGMTRCGADREVSFKGSWCVERWYGLCRDAWLERRAP